MDTPREEFQPRAFIPNTNPSLQMVEAVHEDKGVPLRELVFTPIIGWVISSHQLGGTGPNSHEVRHDATPIGVETMAGPDAGDWTVYDRANGDWWNVLAFGNGHKALRKHFEECRR